MTGQTTSSVSYRRCYERLYCRIDPNANSGSVDAAALLLREGMMKFLKEGQKVVSDNPNGATGIGHGKTTGGVYDCEMDCEYKERFSIYWNDGTLKYPCEREVEYEPETDSWKVKNNIPPCKHEVLD